MTQHDDSEESDAPEASDESALSDAPDESGALDADETMAADPAPDADEPVVDEVADAPVGGEAADEPVVDEVADAPVGGEAEDVPAADLVTAPPAVDEADGAPAADDLADAPVIDGADDAPIDDAPIDDAPIDDAPIDDAPIDDVPMDDAADEVVDVPAADEVVDVPAADEVVGVPAADEVVGVPAADEVVDVPAADEVVGVPAADEVVDVPAADEVVDAPAVDEADEAGAAFDDTAERPAVSAEDVMSPGLPVMPAAFEPTPSADLPTQWDEPVVPLAGFEPVEPGAKERPGGWVVWSVVAALVVIIVGGYAAGHLNAGDKVPRGATVSGVDVGGLTRAEARDELEAVFAERERDPIEVSVDGQKSAEVRPDEVGLQVDYEATLDAAGATRSWSPARQWDYYVGGDDVDAVVEYDDEQLTATLDELSEGLGTPPTDGRVRFGKGGRVRTSEPKDGRAIDPDTAREAIAAAFLGEDETAALTVVPAEPEIDADDVATAVETLAEPAVADPVTLVFGDAEVTLRPGKIGRALRFVPDDGALAMHVRQKVLAGLVKDATAQGEPVDATVKLVRGQPKVVPAKPGVQFQPSDVSAVFADLVRADGEGRTGEVEAKVDKAEFTTQDAKALGIKEKVSEFTTNYPHPANNYRNINIGRAAELIDGTVLKPGEIFSMNDIVGERTAENGFVRGGVISGGILKEDYGGSVSQMATTLFNAMYFAGLKDVEHKPHSFYISRYPEGRESTIAWGSFDFRFQNDTEYGVLVHTYITPSTPARQGAVTVEMYSTKVWDISSSTSDRYAFTSPTTRYVQDPGCLPNTGWSGFQVDVTRTFREHGEDEVDHTETFHTVYKPADTVVCGPPPGQNDGGNGGGDGGGDGGGNDGGDS